MMRFNSNTIVTQYCYEHHRLSVGLDVRLVITLATPRCCPPRLYVISALHIFAVFHETLKTHLFKQTRSTPRANAETTATSAK